MQVICLNPHGISPTEGFFILVREEEVGTTGLVLKIALAMLRGSCSAENEVFCMQSFSTTPIKLTVLPRKNGCVSEP